MNAERWKRIDEIFHAALDHKPSERAEFLSEACEDDSLRAEVEQLIATHEKESSLFENPASDLAAEFLAKQRDMIAHYRILKKIGSGGMGEVYLAEDTRLNRKVALKLLPQEFTKDKERTRRFEREARAVTALNHPYILTIYDIGQFDSSTYIASEFIDGETLRSRMRKSKMPLKEILSISIQVAEALDAAHSAGIIHRDIKPENIMLRADGYVKVLDFGLSKSIEPELNASRLDTLTSPDTQTGVVIGTVRYMSPEQARGLNVDVRTDLFSLGVVLYEIITGKVPFDGATSSDVLVAILEKQPSALRTYGDFPDELQWIATKTLAKDRNERYQTAKDLVVDLKRIRKNLEVSEELKRSDRSESAKAQTGWPKKLIKIFAIAVVLTAVIALFQIISKKPSNRLIKNLNQKQKQITFIGTILWSAISPDGKFIAYYQLPDQILVQSIRGGNPIQVSYPGRNVRDIRWSPDSAQLLLATVSEKGQLECLIVSPFGGQPQHISAIGTINSWSYDSLRIASTDYPSKYIRITSIPKPEKPVLLKINLPIPFVFIHDLDWSGTGRFAMLVSNETHNFIATMNNNGSQPEIVVTESSDTIKNLRWAWDSKAIYYWRRGKNRQWELMKVEIASETGKSAGRPKMILSQPGPMLSLTFSHNGILAYSREASKSNIWALTLNDSKKEWSKKQLTYGTWLALFPALSPDGKTIAFDLTKDNTSIFTVPVAGGTLRQLTFEEKECKRPAWSPTGKSIAAVCNDDGVLKVVVISADGSVPNEFRSTNVSNSWFLSWAPGNSILYQLPDNRNFHFLDPNTAKETMLLKDTSRGWIFDALVSPDQKKAAFTVNWGAKNLWGIWIENLTEHSGDLLVRGALSKAIGWSRDSKWLYFSGPSDELRINKINVDTHKTVLLPPIPIEKAVDWISMAPDEKTFAAEVLEYEADVWITENFDPEAIQE